MPNWFRMKTDNKIRYNAKRRHWRRTKLKFWLILDFLLKLYLKRDFWFFSFFQPINTNRNEFFDIFLRLDFRILHRRVFFKKFQKFQGFFGLRFYFFFLILRIFSSNSNNCLFISIVIKSIKIFLKFFQQINVQKWQTFGFFTIFESLEIFYPMRNTFHRVIFRSESPSKQIWPLKFLIPNVIHDFQTPRLHSNPIFGTFC